MAENTSQSSDDTYPLYDLRVEVVKLHGKDMVCKHDEGDYFELHGEMLSLPPGQPFSIYVLAALLPLLPAKQRITHKNDWMTTDSDVACPDPNCGAIFRISRKDLMPHSHSEDTVVPLQTE